jgi:hypothetical protein
MLLFIATVCYHSPNLQQFPALTADQDRDTKVESLLLNCVTTSKIEVRASYPGLAVTLAVVKENVHLKERSV